MATRSQTTTQVTWAASDTNTVAADAAIDTSDDFTFSSDLIQTQISIEATNNGTAVSGDTIDIYMQHKQDPDNDATDTYDTQGDYVCTLDTYEDNTAQKTVGVYGLLAGQVVRFGAINNGASTITIGVSVIEDKLAY